METLLIDTNVLSAMLVEDELKFYVESRPAAISCVAYIEMIQGTKPKRYIDAIERYILQYPIIYPEPSTCALAIDLIKIHSSVRGLRLPDAIIAALCLERNFVNLTFNVSDFDFIEGLKLFDIQTLSGKIASRIVGEKRKKSFRK